MTPTEKKYAKILGNLYWENVSFYDRETSSYVDDKQLVMVTKLYRRYGESGDYYYQLEILQKPEAYRKIDDRVFKNMRAKRFEELTNNEHSGWSVLAS